MPVAKQWAQNTVEKVWTYNWDRSQALLAVHLKEVVTGKVLGELGLANFAHFPA